MMATEYKLSYTASEIDERLGKVDEIDSLKQNLFSGDYNDLKNAPNIIENGDGELFIAGQNGNVIFCVNATFRYVYNFQLIFSFENEKV